jgi:hypothetical protein
MNPISFANANAESDAKSLNLPSYSQIRPYLVRPVKDVIKVINATCPKISTSGISLGCPATR